MGGLRAPNLLPWMLGGPQPLRLLGEPLRPRAPKPQPSTSETGGAMAAEASGGATASNIVQRDRAATTDAGGALPYRPLEWMLGGGLTGWAGP
jgi:hypothetical protein